MTHLEKTVWLTLKPSPIHGIGVFALRDIPRDTKVIWEYDTVEVCTLDQGALNALPIEILNEILSRVIFVKGEPLSFLDPNCVTNYRSYMNHSRGPNTDGISTLVDIKKDTELTEDYTQMGNWHDLTKTFMGNVL